MAQLLVRNLEDNTLAALKERAKASGRSLQAEVKAILDEVANDAERKQRFREIAEKWQTRWRAEGKTFSDSAEIIREMRDER